MHSKSGGAGQRFARHFHTSAPRAAHSLLILAATGQVSARSWPAGKWWPSQPAGGRLAATSSVDGAGAARTARRERCACRTPRPLTRCIAPAAPQCAPAAPCQCHACRAQTPTASSARLPGAPGSVRAAQTRGGQATASGWELADAGGELAFWAWPQLSTSGGGLSCRRQPPPASASANASMARADELGEFAQVRRVRRGWAQNAAAAARAGHAGRAGVCPRPPRQRRADRSRVLDLARARRGSLAATAAMAGASETALTAAAAAPRRRGCASRRVGST